MLQLSCFPHAAWKNEVQGDAFRKLEQQWRSVVLLIVDEISFIGRAFFARMHFRLQQAKRRFFSEAALDPNDYTFGNISNVLVGDFGQLEPIEDWSMCDTEATFQTCPKTLRHLWRHACQGELLMQTFDEGHMIGGFLYDEPALGLEENEINEGIRIFCFLTRSAEATAGYGEAPATRFLSVDRSRELYSRWRAYARWHAYADTLPCYDWVSDSTSDDCGEPTPLVHLAPQPMMPGQHSAMRVLRTTPPEGVLKVG